MSNLSTRKVLPTGPVGSDILLVGESPGEEEDKEGKPFVGWSGNILWDGLKRYSKNRENIRTTNINNYHPKDNNFEFVHNSPQLQEGLNEIEEYCKQYRPKVIGAIGAQSLYYLTGRNGILAHRSSILQYNRDTSIKVVPAIHPAYLYRIPQAYLYFDFDLRRIVEESKDPAFNYTPREYILVHDYLTKAHVDLILSTGEIGVDIEATTDKETKQIVPITICFSPSPNLSITCVWNSHNYVLIKEILERKDVTKYFHYGWCFDVELLHLYGINVEGLIHDTFIMSQILDPALPRSLAFLTTTYTREPYYKKVGRDTLPEDTKVWGVKTNREEVMVYNSKDGAVTIEVGQKLLNILREENKLKKYYFKLRCAKHAQSMSRIGMPIDNERRELFKKAVAYKRTRLQQILNLMCGRTVNVNSYQGKKSVKVLLYEELSLPVRKHRDGRIKSDEKALLSLMAHCQGEIDKLKTEEAKAKWILKREICKTIIEIRGLAKLFSSYIDIKLSVDGTAKSTMNVSGTGFERWSASLYVDDTGLNGMTFPRGTVHIPDDMPDEFTTKSIIEQLQKEVMEDESDQDED